MNIAPNILLATGQSMPASVLPSMEMATPDTVIPAFDFAAQVARIPVASDNQPAEAASLPASMGGPVNDAPADTVSRDVIASSAALVAALTGDSEPAAAQPDVAKVAPPVAPRTDEKLDAHMPMKPVPNMTPASPAPTKITTKGKAATKEEDRADDADDAAFAAEVEIPAVAQSAANSAPVPLVPPSAAVPAAVTAKTETTTPVRNAPSKVLDAKSVELDPTASQLPQHLSHPAAPPMARQDSETATTDTAYPALSALTADSDALSKFDMSSVKIDTPVPMAAPIALRPVGGTQMAAPVAVERELDLMRSAEWLDRLARDIAGSANKADSMTFRLRPARLGQLDVSLASGQDGMAVQLATQGEEARRIVAASQPRLIENLQAHGVKVAEARVVDANQLPVGGTAAQGAFNMQAGTHSQSQAQQGARPAETAIESAAALPDAAENEDQANHSGRFA